MAQQAPGMSPRQGISVRQLMKVFPTEEVAQKWLESEFSPQGPHCPHCGSSNVQLSICHSSSMTHRCRDCPNRPQFSVRSGTVMNGTRLKYRDWAVAVYLLTSNLKGLSGMKLHRNLEINQKSAWHLMHRLQTTFEATGTVFGRPCMERGHVITDERLRRRVGREGTGLRPVDRRQRIGVGD